MTPAYGRKGHLRAVYLRRGDGSTAVQSSPRAGTNYSFREHLESGHVAWSVKGLGKSYELRPVFLQVVTDCMVSS